MLITLFNLRPTPEEIGSGRTAASVRAERERRKLESAWESSGGTAWDTSGMELSAEELNMGYEILEKDRGKKKGKQGLLAQTILEEDDDSEEGF